MTQHHNWFSCATIVLHLLKNTWWIGLLAHLEEYNTKILLHACLIKFSKSFAFHTLIKGFGLGTRTFVGVGFEMVEVPQITTFLNIVIYPLKDSILPLNSSMIVVKEATRSFDNLFQLSSITY